MIGVRKLKDICPEEIDALGKSVKEIRTTVHNLAKKIAEKEEDPSISILNYVLAIHSAYFSLIREFVDLYFKDMELIKEVTEEVMSEESVEDESNDETNDEVDYVG